MSLASIVIATRNRRDDVLRAVASCFAQDYPALEVLLFDDASEDGTVDAIGTAFLETRIFKNAERRGYILNRNRGFEEAKGDYVFSIDDDAYFSAEDTVARTVEAFAADFSIGAIAIPYIEPLNRRSLSSLNRPFHSKPGNDLRNFVGCAHAVRRDAALALGGYRNFLVHQGEERDFCLRLRAKGWRIVYGASEPVVHLVSPSRDSERVAFYGARNQVLFEFLNVPFPQSLLRVVWVSVATIRYRFSWKTLGVKLRGLAAGLSESVKQRQLRHPVDWQTYRTFRSLPAHGPEERESTPPPITKPSNSASASHADILPL